MYVALTRARNHLAVTYPLQAYSSRGSAEYSFDQLSRFIDRGVREKMERVTLAADDSPMQNPSRAPVPMIDLRALLSGKFKPAQGS
jgi:ATP-dependent exoDNAse (exonuclease V) beta subunit